MIMHAAALAKRSFLLFPNMGIRFLKIKGMVNAKVPIDLKNTI
jgi:hypothetical protein